MAVKCFRVHRPKGWHGKSKSSTSTSSKTYSK
jgi:hypothetical protein